MNRNEKRSKLCLCSSTQKVKEVLISDLIISNVCNFNRIIYFTLGSESETKHTKQFTTFNIVNVIFPSHDMDRY
jgi:hypothetical protein